MKSFKFTPAREAQGGERGDICRTALEADKRSLKSRTYPEKLFDSNGLVKQDRILPHLAAEALFIHPPFFVTWLSVMH